MMQKGLLQVNQLRLAIRPYLQTMTTALLFLGLLGGWAGPNWLTVLIIFSIMIAIIVWIGRQARLHGAKPIHAYASTLINLIAAAAIVIITGGAYSPFWLLFLIGAVTSAISLQGRAGVRLEWINAGSAALAFIGPAWVDGSLDRPLAALAAMQVFTLLMSGTLIRRITTMILEGNQRYRTLIDTARDVIFTVAPDGKMTSLNPSFEPFTGWSRAEWLGRSFEELILEEDRARARDHFDRILHGETLHATRLRIHTRTRGVMVVQANMSAETKDGHVVGLLGIARDMTEEQATEDALRASETRFRALLEGGWDAFTLADPQGMIVYASASTARVLGYESEELVGVSAFTLFHPDDMEVARGQLLEVLQSPGSSIIAQVRTRHKDGSWRWLEAVVTNLLAEPTIQGLVTKYRDVTARKMTEEALIESRAQLSGIIESAMDAIITLDAHQRIILFNAAAEQMFGCPAGEMIGQSIDRFIPERLRAAHREHIHRFGQTGVTARSMRMLNTLTGLRCDGSEFPIEASISQMNVKGQKLYTVIVRDITERKKAEEDLRAAETRYRTLVEQLPIVVYVNPANDINSTVYVSPQIQSYVGYTREEWLENPKFWSNALHPEDRQRVLAQVERVNQSGEPFDVEYRLIGRDGRAVWIRDHATLLHDREGRPLLWQGLMMDITGRKLSEQQIKRQIDHLRALRVIDMAITSSTDLHLSLQILLKQAVSQLQIDAADILLLNRATHVLEYAEGIGFRTRGIERSFVRFGDEYAGRAVRERRMISICNLKDEAANFPRGPLIEGENFTSYFGVPLTVKGEVKGVLEVFHRQPIEPDQEWLDFLEALAGQAALAIDNSTLFESLQRSHIELSLAYETTLEGWSAALDLRDKETEGHTRRVVDLTLRLAEHMGIKDRELIHIRRGALLHDIGKMGVPDRILLKPDDLTPDEWEIMQRHPAYAYELLSRIEYLRPALAIPYCHHEKWNGTGYPRGLKREEIPLEARIFAVVDVYDAITSDRPYRPAWTKEKALEHIQSLSGEYFDPKVVKAFLELLGQG